MAYTDIDKSDDYFNTVLYTGNASSRSITGVNFQPDWVWIKRRSTGDAHYLFDNVRTATKYMSSNNTDTEITNANTLTSFDSDGFSLGTVKETNKSGETFVGWNWLGANGTASNTDGSITSTVSANTTSGFSVVSYTGSGANATVGHGLGSAPACYMVKSRDTGYDWRMYHQAVGETKFMILNQSASATTATNNWNDTAPTSSVFSLGTGVSVNRSGDDFIAYCFAEKKGYSKMSQYTGNGSSDGPFIYTGFKPAWVIQKGINNSNGWHVHDNKRDTINPCDAPLYPQATFAEGTDTLCDFLSNGLKIRSTLGSRNGNGSTYLIMAFAENPFVTSTGIPGLAR